MFFRIDLTLKLQLGELLIHLLFLALDDLHSELLAADLANRLDSRLTDLRDYIVLIKLVGEALGIQHDLQHTLADGLLHEEQSKSPVQLWMQATNWIDDERRLILLARSRREAQFVGWRL